MFENVLSEGKGAAYMQEGFCPSMLKYPLHAFNVSYLAIGILLVGF